MIARQGDLVDRLEIGDAVGDRLRFGRFARTRCGRVCNEPPYAAGCRVKIEWIGARRTRLRR
jgi:hypothetical protein